jgi:acid stress-induced BolA-like protein IbaG/YrbA
MKKPKVKIRGDNYHLFVVMIASLLRKRIRSVFYSDFKVAF